MFTQYPPQKKNRKRKLVDLVRSANEMVGIAQSVVDFASGKLLLSPAEKEEKIKRLRSYCEDDFSFLTNKEKTYIEEEVEQQKKRLEDSSNPLSAEKIELKIEETRAIHLKNIGMFIISLNSPQGLALEQIAKKVERRYNKEVSNLVRNFMKRNFLLITILSEEKLKDLSIELDKMFVHGMPTAESVVEKIKPYLAIGDLNIDEKLRMVDKCREEDTKLRIDAEQRAEEQIRLREKAEHRANELARLSREADQRAAEQTRLKMEENKQSEELREQISELRKKAKQKR